MDINIPENVSLVLERLAAAGHSAYIVGGCVRDAIMGKTPHDYDITTSATPAETKAAFSDFRVIETGIKHGTVTVMAGCEPIEITTFRVDGEYLDGRHPESVSFSRNIRDDLSRRDFAINGIAYNPSEGLVDLYSGCGDISRRLIRCIGDPDVRFNEDALRILRAMRFSSVLGFDIEEKTAAAMLRGKSLLSCVSAERIFSELQKMLVGQNMRAVFMRFSAIAAEIIPELTLDMSLYEKNVSAAQRAAEICGGDPALPFSMLLKDIAQPTLQADDREACAEKSAETADEILRRLKCSNALRTRVCGIVRYHGEPLSLSDKEIRRGLSAHGESLFLDIVAAHICEDSAGAEYYTQIAALAGELVKTACLTIKDLAVSGKELQSIVPPSPKLGEVLSQLLSEVIDGELENDKSVLLARAKQLLER